MDKAELRREVGRKAAGRRWQFKGGLRSGERLLLQRAVAFYSNEYGRMKQKAKEQREKDDLQQYIEAADAMHERLRMGMKELSIVEIGDTK